jgi:hypothetical protein
VDAFGVLDKVLADYESFVAGFLNIQDDRVRQALGAFDVADFVRTIAAPSARANHHDLQPALRIEAIDMPDLSGVESHRRLI